MKVSARQLCLLSLLANFGQMPGGTLRKMYGQRVRSFFGLSLVGFYSDMAKLEDAGLVRGENVPGGHERGGAIQRIFKVTRDGSYFAAGGAR